MVTLITGASHTGKTMLAQRLLEKRNVPYLSIDHLKMGLIRSGCTSLTPMDDNELCPYLWKIVREIIKTAIENRQELIIEGCYIPFDWENDFAKEYIDNIVCYCLIMSADYIRANFAAIKAHANDIEARLDDSTCALEHLLADNARYAAFKQSRRTQCIIINGEYTAALAAILG